MPSKQPSNPQQQGGESEPISELSNTLLELISNVWVAGYDYATMGEDLKGLREANAKDRYVIPEALAKISALIDKETKAARFCIYCNNPASICAECERLLQT